MALQGIFKSDPFSVQMLHPLQIKICLNWVQESNCFTDNQLVCHSPSDPISSKASSNGAVRHTQSVACALVLTEPSLLQNTSMSPSFPTILCHNFPPLFLNWEETLLESHHTHSRTWSSCCANVTCMCVRAQKFTNHLSTFPHSLWFCTHTHSYICVYIHSPLTGTIAKTIHVDCSAITPTYEKSLCQNGLTVKKHISTQV